MGGWGLRRIGSDGSSIPSFRTSIRGTNHRFLPIIFREIDNYVSFDWRQGFETIVNDLRVVLCNINESSVYIEYNIYDIQLYIIVHVGFGDVSKIFEI